MACRHPDDHVVLLESPSIATHRSSDTVWLEDDLDQVADEVDDTYMRLMKLHVELEARQISHERIAVRRRRKSFGLLRSIARMFSRKRRASSLSERADEQNELADVATRDRIVSLLRVVSAGLQPGASSIDRSDVVQHLLAAQAQWLQRSLEMHKHMTLQLAPNETPAHAMTQFLAKFLLPHGQLCVPPVDDRPSEALVRFLKLVSIPHFIKPQMRRAFEQFTHDAVQALLCGNEPRTCRMWASLDPRDSIPLLVEEIVEVISRASALPGHLEPVLRAFVEQLVFSRLTAVCCERFRAEIASCSQRWLQQVGKARALRLEDLGLTMPASAKCERPFANTIRALERMPHLVPSSILAAFMHAIRVLHIDAQEAFAKPLMSGDMLLGSLVYVLSRCSLPYLHTQVFLMVSFALGATPRGTEDEYFVASLQAAMECILDESWRT